LFSFFFKFVIFLCRVCKSSYVGLQPLEGSADPRRGRRNPGGGSAPRSRFCTPDAGFFKPRRAGLDPAPVLHTPGAGFCRPSKRVCNSREEGLQTVSGSVDPRHVGLQTRSFVSNPVGSCGRIQFSWVLWQHPGLMCPVSRSMSNLSRF